MSNDAVSRDGVKNLLTRIRDEIDEGYGFNYQEAVEELMGMPSTQPQLEQSTHSEQGKSDELGVKSGKTCTDTISRQAAITAIQKAYTDTEGGTDKCAVWKNVGLTNALHIMQDLPPAQPERCSDCIVHGGDWECDHMHCRKGRLPSAQPERTEERTETHSCDYCHEDSDGYVKPIEKNCHAVIFGSVLYLKAKEWRGEVEIKYCPMCGRRLER